MTVPEINSGRADGRTSTAAVDPAPAQPAMPEQDRDRLAVLVVSPVRLLREALGASLEARLTGCTVATSNGGSSVRAALGQRRYDVVLVDTTRPLHAEMARVLAEAPAHTRVLAIGRPPADAGLRHAEHRFAGTIRRDVAAEALLKILRAPPVNSLGTTAAEGATQGILLTRLLRRWSKRRSA